MTVLVIDDEQDIRLMAQVGLRAAGMTVLLADNGAEGVRAALAEQPDAILLDVMMPGMDGYETFKALQTSPATAAIPVVFLTARNPDGRDARTRGASAAGFITKPFLPRELADSLRKALGR